MAERKKKPTDWRKRFGAAKDPHVVMLHADFAGVKAGTAIYLRVVAEVALTDLAEGKALDQVVPFWRVVLPGSKVAAKLSCGPDHVAHLIALDQGAATG
jgi:hypothetical protein